MENKYPKNADPRPKRRKDKENPYTIYSIGGDTETPRYYAEFDDSEGKHRCVELDAETFAALDRFELDDLAYMTDKDRHYTDAEVEDIAAEEDITEKVVMRHMECEYIHFLLQQLPEIQRRRMYLYYFENYTYAQIAEVEGCKYQAIQDSIQAAKKFLKKFLKTDL